MRVSTNQLFPLIPSVMHKGIRSSRYFAEKTSTLLIQADDSRKQQANKESCFRKLNDLIVEVYNHTIPGETSQEQKERVQRLQKAQTEARLKTKRFHSTKKQFRGKGGFE